MELNEVIEKYENGEAVRSVEMGGLSDGYEEAIQTLGFRLAKQGESIKSYDGFEIPEDLKGRGYSGAQVGAAINLCNVFLKNGYEGGLKLVDESRIIIVRKKHLPKEV